MNDQIKNEIQIREILSILYRYNKFIILVMVLGFILSIFYIKTIENRHKTILNIEYIGDNIEDRSNNILIKYNNENYSKETKENCQENINQKDIIINKKTINKKNTQIEIIDNKKESTLLCADNILRDLQKLQNQNNQKLIKDKIKKIEINDEYIKKFSSTEYLKHKEESRDLIKELILIEEIKYYLRENLKLKNQINEINKQEIVLLKPIEHYRILTISKQVTIIMTSLGMSLLIGLLLILMRENFKIKY